MRQYSHLGLSSRPLIFFGSNHDIQNKEICLDPLFNFSNGDSLFFALQPKTGLFLHWVEISEKENQFDDLAILEWDD